jgi:tetratricopeptide (TPR) repeat protein
LETRRLRADPQGVAAAPSRPAPGPGPVRNPVAAALPIAVALVTLIAFAPALLNGFVWDDEGNFLNNPHYRGLGWAQLRWMATTTLMGHWIPLTWLTLGLDYALWGMNPVGYHLTNLLLHTAAAVVFYFVALRLLGLSLQPSSPQPLRLGAVTAALFFAVHPLRVESVAWVTERRDVLSGLLFLLTILAYLKASASGGARRRQWSVASVTAYALALLSKSIVMTLPLVLIVLDIYPLRRLPADGRVSTGPSAGRVWAEKLPYLLLAIGAAVLAYRSVSGKTSLEQMPVLSRVALVLHSLAFYAGKTLVPLGLSPLYELPSRVDPLARPFLMSAIALGLVTAAAWLGRRRWPAGLALWITYAVMLAPVAGLVRQGPQIAANRYTYLACLGWAVLAGAGVATVVEAGRRRVVRPAFSRAAVGIAALWVIGLAAVTWDEVQAWRDADTLWRSALEVDPACASCHGNLAVSLDTRRFSAGAIEHYRRALALRPDDPGYVRRNLGLALLKTGRPLEAIEQFRLRLAGYPNDVEVRNYLGVTLIQVGKPDLAVEQLREVIRLDPHHAGGMTNLGLALNALGRPAEAIPHFQRAIALNPGDPLSRFGLARAFLAIGNVIAAREQLEVLRRIEPRLVEEALAGAGASKK